MKRCVDCLETKPLVEFGIFSRQPDGRHYYCRICARRRANASRLRHREKINAKARASYAADRDGKKERHRQWCLDNLERRRASHAAASRRWYEKNQKLHAQRVLASALKRRDAPTVPFTLAQLNQRLSMFVGCWMCGDEPDTVDHVKPLAKGGAHMLANLRPACKSCNSSKGATWPWPMVSTLAA